MIVSVHSVSHGIVGTMNKVSVNSCWFHIESSVCLLAVNIFVLISGYFLVNERFRVSKLFRVTIETIFYSWIIFACVFFGGGGSEVGGRGVITALLPISFNQYWFISAYVGMYILSPGLNLLIRNISQKQHLGIILLAVAYFSLWNSLIPYSQPMGIHRFGQSVVWFMVLYLIAAYLRLYSNNGFFSLRRVKCAFFISIAFINLSWIVLTLLGKAFGLSLGDSITEYYFHYNSFPVLVASVSFFVWFREVRVERSFMRSMIRFAGPLCFGVYLIHDNPNIREFVWGGLRLIPGETWSLPLLAMGYALMVFLACLLIDYLRSLLFKVVNQRNWYKSFLSRMDNQIYESYNSLIKKCIE